MRTSALLTSIAADKKVFSHPLLVSFSRCLSFYIDPSLPSLIEFYFLFIWLFEGLDQKLVSGTIFYASDRGLMCLLIYKIKLVKDMQAAPA
jgi:hypothetical protein